MKVLIVDDEVIARIGLTNAIDWKANGYYIVGDAADAETAKKLARMYKPDIVIVDIVMPDVNGLELIRALKNEIPLSKFIIISCMDDKEYYKEALELGVCGYINKASFRKEQLLEVLQKVSKSIYQDRVVEETYDEADHLNRFAILSSFLNLAIRSGSYDRMQVREKFQSFDIDIQEPYYLMLIGTDALPDDTREYIEQSASVVCYDIVRSVCSGFVFQSAQKEILAILAAGTLNAEYLQSLCRRIQTTFEQYFDICPPIGISGRSDDFGRLKDTYRMACAAVRMHYFTEQPYYVYQPSRPVGALPERTRQIMDKLMDVSLEDDAGSVEALLQSLQQSILQEGYYDRTACQNLYLNFLYHLYNLGRAGGNVPDGTETGEFEPTKLVDGSRTLAELTRHTGEAFVRLRARAANAVLKGDDLLRRVERYVQEHIYEKIRIEDIAGEVYLSPAYLGRVYKKMTGVSLHTYVNARKVEFSKRLLLDGQDVNTVAESLMFSSTSYYISLFKQQVGITPKQYLLKQP